MLVIYTAPASFGSHFNLPVALALTSAFMASWMYVGNIMPEVIILKTS